MSINLKNIVIAFFISFFLAIVPLNNANASVEKDPAIANGALSKIDDQIVLKSEGGLADRILASVYKYGYGFVFNLTYALSVLIGLIFLIAGLLKLKLRTEAPNDPRAKTSAIIVTLLMGALLVNPLITSVIFMEGVSSGEYECSALNCHEPLLEEGGAIEKSISSSVSGDAKTRILGTFRPILMLLQIMGFVILVATLIKGKQISEDPNKGTVGEIVVKLIGAAALMNISSTISIIIELWNSFTEVT